MRNNALFSQIWLNNFHVLRIVAFTISLFTEAYNRKYANMGFTQNIIEIYLVIVTYPNFIDCIKNQTPK